MPPETLQQGNDTARRIVTKPVFLSLLRYFGGDVVGRWLGQFFGKAQSVERALSQRSIEAREPTQRAVQLGEP